MLLIKNGRYINPATSADMICDVLIEDGKVLEVSKNIQKADCELIDATGCIVVPGFIDLHVHLREPGFEHKETIETGSRAAAAGGFTTICAMPNTKPATDSADKVEWMINKAKEVTKINVLPIGSVTKGQAGKELSDIVDMKNAGACGISEDGKSVMDADLYKKALKIAADNDIPVFAHCEEITMVDGCVVNAGPLAKKLGVGGVPNACEDIIAKRDIEIAKEYGTRLHLCHCSTKECVDYIKEGKEKGVKLTAEVCPHHFLLSEEDVDLKDSNYKMNPPIRAKEDMEALIYGIKNKVFDCISTDHAPHAKEEKDKGFLDAPCGIVGLETSFPLSYTYLVKNNIIDLNRLIEMMSLNPARVLGIDKGDISKGKCADIAVINIDEEYSVDINSFKSKANNSPFGGWKVSAKIMATIANGEIAYKN